MAPEDDDNRDFEPDEPTRLDAQPLAETTADTPPRPASLFAGYDQANADGRREGYREGIYAALREGAKILGTRNTPGKCDQFSEAVARRLGVPWPPV